jgi:hypothetical protein
MLLLARPSMRSYGSRIWVMYIGWSWNSIFYSSTRRSLWAGLPCSAIAAATAATSACTGPTKCSVSVCNEVMIYIPRTSIWLISSIAPLHCRCNCKKSTIFWKKIKCSCSPRAWRDRGQCSRSLCNRWQGFAQRTGGESPESPDACR